MEITAFSFQEVNCLQDYSVCGLVVYSCAIYLLQIKKKRKQLCFNYHITCGEKQQIYSCLFCIWSSRKFSRVIKVDDVVVRNPSANVGDLGPIPGLDRSPGGGNGNPLQYSCLENSMDREAWWAMVQRVAKSQTRLKRLSMWILVSRYQNWVWFQEPLNLQLVSEVQVDLWGLHPQTLQLTPGMKLTNLPPNSVCETHWPHPGEISLS